MQVLIAPDKFKGTYTAAEVAGAMARGLGPHEPDLCPVADGGDGTATLLTEERGGTWIEAPSHDALGREIVGRYAMLADEVAIVEASAASGLARLVDERDAIEADTFGTGELIADAIARGARTVLVGCGGSATTDGGVGALRAFEPQMARIVCLCDVREPFEGAINYAPQKGAGKCELAVLEHRLARLAEELPRDPRGVPGAGAAGGLAGGLWAHGAELVSGAAYLLDAVGFEARLQRADLVLTGEGRLDRSSLSGKAVAEVAERSLRAGVPVDAVVGSNAASTTEIRALGLRSVREGSTLDQVTRKVRELIDAAAAPG